MALIEALAANQPSDDILFIAQSGASGLVVQVSVWNDSPEPVEGPITITLTFTLPDGVTFTVGQSVIAGLGNPRFITPEDVDTEPNTTVDDDMRPYQVYWWNTNVTLSGISEDDEIEVVAVISDGMAKSETEELTWSGSFGG